MPVYVLGWNDLRFARRAEKSSVVEVGTDGRDRPETEGNGESSSLSLEVVSYFCSRWASSVS